MPSVAFGALDTVSLDSVIPTRFGIEYVEQKLEIERAARHRCGKASHPREVFSRGPGGPLEHGQRSWMPREDFSPA